MSTIKKLGDKVVWEVTDKGEHVYLMNVPVLYPVVHEPRLKFQSQDEYEYSMTAFIDTEARTFLEDEIIVNKTIAEVGKDKNKKRAYKYPLSTQREDKKDLYDLYEGMHGIGLTCPAKTKAGNERKIKIYDENGEEMTDKIGNGSIAIVKLFGYRNKEDMLNITISAIKVLNLVEYIENKSEGDSIMGIGAPAIQPEEDGDVPF